MGIAAKRVIVLGASGFVGKYLFDEFSKAKELETIGFSSKELDLLSPRDLMGKLLDVTPGDVLIVAAAITRLKENTFNSMSKNIQMVENIANVIDEHPVGQVVYLSTIDVYGIELERGCKITEQTELAPNDYYAISKLTGEFLLKRMCGQRKIPLAILRLCGVYGPGDIEKSTIGTIVSAALRNKKITIYGDGKNLRDYVYVDDIYRIIRRIVTKRLNVTLNIATGRSYSIFNIAHMVQSLLPHYVSIEFKRKSGKKSVRRVRDLMFDISLFKKNFRGVQLKGIEKGVSDYLQHTQRTG